MIKGRFNFFFKEDAKWGEQEMIKFRWILIILLFLFIGYRYLSGDKGWAAMAASLAVVFVFYNLMLNYLVRIFTKSLWISYLSVTIDILVLSLYIYNYAYHYNFSAITTSATILLYPVLIMFSVLRYNGRLVIYSTTLVIVAYNIIYALIRPAVPEELLNTVASMDWAGQVYRSAYLGLMGYFMFSIPIMIDRLVNRQMNILKEHNETEIKLALERQEKELVVDRLKREKDLNEKLNEQSKLIKEQKEKLEAANTTKDRLFSIVGHDLRSPLAVQCSLTELLSSNYDNLSKEEILEIVNAINDSAKHGISLLSNLLDWAMSQNENKNSTNVPVSVEKVVNDSIALFYANANYKNIKISVSLEKNLTVFADANMLETIIRNLLSNAIKFSPRGKEIKIKAMKKRSDILICVTDEGIGMTKKQLKNLFKISSQSSKGTENEPGTGIGLMLCKELAEKNNGTIEASSKPGEGTEFTLKLPVFCNSSAN